MLFNFVSKNVEKEEISIHLLFSIRNMAKMRMKEKKTAIVCINLFLSILNA